MESWKTVCVYVSVYAVLREFRPIDPFFIQYLTLLPEKYTVQTIRREIYPLGTYASVFFVVIIFLVTDYLRYKPIMVLNGLSGVMSYGLLLGSPSIVVLRTGQVFQTLFRAAEVAYCTYLFAKIGNKAQYRIANSAIRTSVLLGKFSCGALSQALVSFNLVSYAFLLYLSIFGMMLTTTWSLMMPPVTCSLYFYKEREPVIPTIVIDKTAVVRTKTAESNTGDMHRTNIERHLVRMKCAEVMQKLWADFTVTYADANVFKWSMWWSLSLCGYVLVAQYVQLQWQHILAREHNAALMNGVVESLATLFSAVAAYTIGRVNDDWDKHAELIMAMVAIGQAVVLFFLAVTESLTMSYVYYVVFCCTYQTMLTISSAEVAKSLKRDCYALAFGFNKFIAYVIIAVFTVVVVEDTFVSFNIRQQFQIYSAYFGFMGCLFMLMGVVPSR